MSLTFTRCVVALVVGATVVCGLSYERVRIVDRVTDGTHFLFRGDVPDWTADDSHMAPENRSASAFQWGTLTKYFRMRVHEAGLPPLPSDDQLFVIDVNLLANESAQERNAIDAERAFFDANKDKGVFVNWPTVGVAADPMATSSAERKALASNFSAWDPDRLQWRVGLLHTWVHGTSAASALPAAAESKTVVVYVHCIGGQDRTGEVIGSYALSFLNLTAPAAFMADWLVAERWPHQPKRNAMQWHCFALEEAGHRRDLACDAMVPSTTAPLPPSGTPCEHITSLVPCGYFNQWCLWVDGHCVSNCRRWPSAALCRRESGCSWDGSGSRCVAKA